MALEIELAEGRQCLGRFTRVELPFAFVSTQGLGDLDVGEVRDVEPGSGIGDAFRNRASARGAFG